MSKAVIIGKFYPPTRGHQWLIDFARSYPGVTEVHVLVCSLDSEAIAGTRRVAALREHFAFDPNTFIYHHHGDMPQYPEEAVDFWDQWRNLIYSYIDVNGFKYHEYQTPFDPNHQDFVFASESYGEQLAAELNCKFVPVDIQRQTIDISATRIRENPLEHFDRILPEFRKHYVTQISFVGPESCGKTTTSKLIADHFHGYWLPEYARGYLDHKGAALDDEKMMDIVLGQVAIEQAVHEYTDKPYVFKDTDLLTCIGWRRRYGYNVPDWLVEEFRKTQSDLFIVLDEDIPFTQDPLRYGGDHRETDCAFWIGILKEFNVPHVLVSGLDYSDRTMRVIRTISDYRKVI